MRRDVRTRTWDSDAGLRLELVETPDGWTLTVHTDAASAALLADVPVFADGGARQRAEISVRPNLVPGEPIPLTAVRVVVEDDPREATTGLGPEG